MDFNVEPFEPCEFKQEYHAVYSIQLCELINDGPINFSSSDWDFDSYQREGVENDREQRDRLWLKFERRFYFREIGIIPYARWKWELLRKLNEIMPKYKAAYKALDEGVDPLQNYSEFGKSRNIFSEFPQTALGNNQDYATNGNDKEYEHIYYGNWMEIMNKLKDYNDIDVMILNELETFFSAMFTVNLNGY